jgi:PAT family beta-lactamase induction signal transducer AmpG
MRAGPEPAPAEGRATLGNTFTVYLQRRVLVVLLLGFSSGLPIVLVGSTLQAWMKQGGIDIKTIGLFAAVAVPYNFKFLWAPLVDAFDLPLLSRWLGRRRGWLLFAQVWLAAAIALLGFSDPVVSPMVVGAAALFTAAASATQDIVVDAFRVESLPESEQAAGMASYVAAYRVGSLVSGAGSLLVVATFQGFDWSGHAAWTACYLAMAALVVVGMIATLWAREPAISPRAQIEENAHAPHGALKRAWWAAADSFRDFLSRDLAVAALVFVALFKLADALAFALLTPFVLDLGFSLKELATIRNGIGFGASLIGGFTGGLIARALPLSSSLWIGGLLQTVMILVMSWQALVGLNPAALTVTTTVEFFTDSIGTVIFVAYLSALCRNPLHTATQYALLTAFAALGRNVFALGTGYLAHVAGWPLYFVTCAALGLPALAMLAFLQHRRHFDALLPDRS